MVTPLFITFISIIAVFGAVTLLFAIFVMLGFNKKIAGKKVQKMLIEDQSTTHTIKNTDDKVNNDDQNSKN